jgi:hypothetical protein
MENRERTATTTTTTTLTFDVKIGEIQGGRRDSHRCDDLLFRRIRSKFVSVKEKLY